MESHNNPLTAMIHERMETLGLSNQRLHERLLEAGLDVSLSAVSMWRSGAGVADRHRPALAGALEISLIRLQRAAIARDQQRAAARTEAA